MLEACNRDNISIYIYVYCTLRIIYIYISTSTNMSIIICFIYIHYYMIRYNICIDVWYTLHLPGQHPLNGHVSPSSRSFCASACFLSTCNGSGHKNHWARNEDEENASKYSSGIWTIYEYEPTKNIKRKRREEDYDSIKPFWELLIRNRKTTKTSWI